MAAMTVDDSRFPEFLTYPDDRRKIDKCLA